MTTECSEMEIEINWRSINSQENQDIINQDISDSSVKNCKSAPAGSRKCLITASVSAKGACGSSADFKTPDSAQSRRSLNTNKVIVKVPATLKKRFSVWRSVMHWIWITLFRGPNSMFNADGQYKIRTHKCVKIACLNVFGLRWWYPDFMDYLECYYTLLYGIAGLIRQTLSHFQGILVLTSHVNNRSLGNLEDFHFILKIGFLITWKKSLVNPINVL